MLLITMFGLSLGFEVLASDSSNEAFCADELQISQISKFGESAGFSVGLKNADIDCNENPSCGDPCHYGLCHFGHCSFPFSKPDFILGSVESDSVASFGNHSVIAGPVLEGVRRPPRLI